MGYGPGDLRRAILGILFFIPLLGGAATTVAAGAAPAPPDTPVITEPSVDNEVVNPADVHMEAWSYHDPDGNPHLNSDVEIWQISNEEKVWESPAIGGIEKNHLHLADGVFVGSYAGKRQLDYDVTYRLQFRFRDSTGEVSPFAIRIFRTSSAGPPGVSSPIPYSAAIGFTVEVVAGGFELPVNIAFVPNPGNAPTDPFFYVTELYGTIKVVLRNGTVGTYAGASALGTPAPNPASLINFNPTGAFPGSGEQGLAGLAVDPATGDVFAGVLYASPAPNGEHYPKVLRFSSTDGGRTASTTTTILQMPGEIQGQSHFISNFSFGPDGKLYVHMGDGFDYTTAPNLNSFRGKILRMNTNGTPATDNPFYNAADGITARDYIWVYGLRNPFGGGWRASDNSHYEVENGPSVDRFAKVASGRNMGWDNSDASMSTFAIYNWSPAHAPVNIQFVQPSTFSGSGFPFAKQDHAFVTESGPTYGEGRQELGKRISEFVLDAAGNLVSGPTTLVEYLGPGRGSCVGLAAGPDGLYFTELYKDENAASPVQAGARVFRVRWIGTNATSGSGLTAGYYSDQTLGNLVLSRTDPTVNFDWGNGSPDPLVPADNFSVRWTGTVTPPTSDIYTFTTTSDDGVRLWINNQLIVDNWTFHAPTDDSGTILLQAGQPYDVKMEFFEAGGGALAQLYWSTSTMVRQIIPQDRLLPFQVAAPVFSPPGGTSSPGPISVTITSTTSGSSIRYTTDGSTPSSTVGTLYAGPVAVNATTTIKAMAFKSGVPDSPVIIAAYTLTAGNGVAAPQFTPGGGTYPGAQSVTISTSTAGASIRYTLDGSTPTSTVGTVYAGPVAVNATTTIKAIAYAAGLSDSTVSSATYTITPPPTVAAPVFTPGAGTYTSAQSVTITTVTAGASIRYTTDGSTPTSTIGTLYAAPVSVTTTTTLKAIGFKAGSIDSSVSSATYSISPSGSGTGLSGSYYNGVNFNTLVLTRVDPTINFDWGNNSPAAGVPIDLWSVRWTGKVQANFSETYTFYTVTDDGVRLWVNGVPLVNKWIDQGATEWSGAIALVAGQQADIVMEYYDTLYGATAKLSWSSPSTPKQIIPQAQLYPPGAAPPAVAAPTFAPPAGGYASAQSVTISTATAGASLRYTLDGSTPTSTVGTVYAGPVAIGATSTLKAIAYKSGSTDSTVTTGVYTLTLPVAAPTFVPGGGNYTAAQSVAVSTATAGASIRYTLDGSTPTSTVGTVYAGPVSIAASATLKAIAFKSGMSDSPVASAAYTITPPSTVVAPGFSPPAGTYTSAQTVTISTSTAGASIRYTTDGSIPTSAVGIVYSGPVAVNTTTTLRAIAYAAGMTDSAVSSATYSILPPVAAPGFSPTGGNYTSAQSVTISTATPGASIRYTTDGSNPTSTIGIVYSGPVAVNTTTTLRAIAYAAGMTDSAVSSATYTIPPPVADPVFAPPAGTYANPVSVTISTPTSGAILRYTTDGTAPSSSLGTVYAGPVAVSSPTTLRAVAYKAGQPDSAVTTGAYTITSGVGTGLTGNYYNGVNFDTLVVTRTDPTINFDWGNSAPAAGMPIDRWSVRWTGKVQANVSENHTFYTVTDDGARLRVNGVLLVDKWIDQGATEWSGTIALVAGQQVDIAFEYYDTLYGATAKLSWSSPSTAKQIIPQAQLFPSGGGAPAVAAPGFTPGGGNYTGTQSVTITSATGGASIRYSLDGSNPTSTTGTLYSAPVSVSATATLKAIAYVSGMTDSSVTSASYTITPPATVSAPAFTPGGGTYTSAQSVTLGSATAGASFRYTLDGSTPTSSVGTLYAGPVSIVSNTTMKAIAFKSGMTDSAVSAAAYTIAPPAAAPVFAPGGGTYTSAQSVTISTTTAGASIRYTTDGSTPTSTVGTLYSAPVPIPATATLKAVAYAAGMTDSGITSATYTITIPVAAPVFAPGGGSYVGTPSVTLSTTTPGASIHYTLDGSTPTSTLGTLYSGPVSIAASATLNAIAFKSGLPDSSVSSAAYAITTAAAAPVYSPGGGTYTSPQSVTISTPTGGASIRYTTDGSTPTSTVGTLYSGPVAIAATTTLKALAFASGMADSGVTTGVFTISAAPGTGLSGAYYNGLNFNTLVLTRTDPTINFDWGNSAPAAGMPIDLWSIRWTGKVLANVSETFTFYTVTDDGVRLWVNGVPLVNKWIDQGATEWSGSIALVAGQQVDIVMEYYDTLYGATAKLSWSSPSTPKQIIPQAQLFPPSAPGPLKAVPAGASGSDLVQGFIDAARPGETVTLGEGVFEFPNGLLVKPGVSLLGAGPGKTVIGGTGANPVLRLMGAPADGRVSVAGMTLTGGTTGLDAGAADVLLTHLVIVRNGGDGVLGSQGGSIDARHLTVADNGGHGLSLFGTATLRNSIVSGNAGLGVSAPYGTGVTYSDVFGNGLGSGADGGLSSTVPYLDPAALDYRVRAGAATVDAGDPADPFDAEPAPNGGRADLGAFGDTADAPASSLKAAAPASASDPSSGGAACGLTGLEAAGALGLLALLRRRRRATSSAGPR